MPMFTNRRIASNMRRCGPRFLLMTLIFLSCISRAHLMKEENDFQQPSRIDAYEGETLYVWCASQNHIQSCLWSFSKSTKLLDDKALIVNDFICIYNLTPAEVHTGEGHWNCFINSKMSPKTTKISVKKMIRDPAAIPYHKVREGLSYQFVCEMTHIETFCLWQLNGFTVNYMSSYKVNSTLVKGEKTVSTLDIPVASKERDFGFWNCMMGRLRSEPVLLTIEVEPTKPSIYWKGKNVTGDVVPAYSHTLLELRCEVNNSSPIAEIYWLMLETETEFINLIPHFSDNAYDLVDVLATWVTAELCYLVVYCCSSHSLYELGVSNSSVTIANAVKCGAVSHLERSVWIMSLAIIIIFLPKK